MSLCRALLLLLPLALVAGAAPPDHVLRLYRTSAAVVATASALPAGLDEARARAVLATRRYAKRQRTWARARMGGWLPVDPAG